MIKLFGIALLWLLACAPSLSRADMLLLHAGSGGAQCNTSGCPLPYPLPPFGTTTVAQCPNIGVSGFVTITLTAASGSRPSNGETSLCDGHSYAANDSYEPTLDLLIKVSATRTKFIGVNGGKNVRLIGASIDATSDSANEMVFVTGASTTTYIEGVYGTGADNSTGQDFIDMSGVVAKGKVSFTANTHAGSDLIDNMSTQVGMVDETTCTPGSTTNPCQTAAGGSLLNSTVIVALMTGTGCTSLGLTSPCAQLDRPPNSSATPATLTASFFYLPTYTMQNNKGVALHGALNLVHSDCSQNVGPIGGANIANTSCTTNYQAFFNPPKYRWNFLNYQNLIVTYNAIYFADQTITGAAKCAANTDVCVTVGSTSDYHGQLVENVQVTGVVMSGSTIVNGTWIITVVDTTHLDLKGTTFIGGDSYSSGGAASTPSGTATLAWALYMSNGDPEAPYAPINNPATFSNVFACWNRSPLYTNAVQPLANDTVAPAIPYNGTGATWGSPMNVANGINYGCPADPTYNVFVTTTSTNYSGPGYRS